MTAAEQLRREQDAAGKLFGLLPADQAQGFRDLWEEFEAAETPDAKRAKALDRLLQILLNHVIGSGTWTDHDVDLSRERSMTNRIADGSPMPRYVAQQVFADAIEQGWLKPAIAGSR